MRRQTLCFQRRMTMDNARFNSQLAFILELDHLKNIYRRTYVLHEDRRENDAEHSFHLAIMACILAEHAREQVDVLHTVKMVLIHDVVEIDAGDTYCYDTEGYKTKAAREQKAADRLFALLPDRQYALLMRYERYGMFLLLALVMLGAGGSFLSKATFWVFDLLCRAVGL